MDRFVTSLLTMKMHLCLVLVILLRDTVECSRPPNLLVLGFDGFRWDYVVKYNATTFKKFANGGVQAPQGLKPAFATKTFPNFWTIATGLYEESHGIIDNDFYDPEYNQNFSRQHDVSKDSKWWGGEPIWVTAQRQGKSAGVYFWPGCNTNINGTTPDHVRNHRKGVPFIERINTVLDWFQNDHIHVGMVYFDEPDTTGHYHGTSDAYMELTIKKLDGFLDFVLKELDRRGLTDQTNVMIVSDHGMTDVDLWNKRSIIYLLY